jgi:putative oxidoreductase
MPLVRSTARPLLASMFITGGLDAVLHPEPKAGAAATIGPGLARRLPFRMPEDPVQLVRSNGAVQLVAGLSLATGRMPRLSALALAGSLVPTTLAGHRFWEKSDKAERKTQQQQFTKNLSMLGGLILAAVDLEGRPGLRHRSHDAVRGLKHASHDLTLHAATTGHRASAAAHKLVPVG